MSVRYGVSLVLDPSFSAGLHRARQVICSQYGCWAAEMHSVHLPLTGYFPCHDEEVLPLAAALEKVADDFRSAYPDASVLRESDVTDAPEEGSIYVPFACQSSSLSEPGERNLLQDEVAEVLSRLNLSLGGEPLPFRFPLLQFSGLPAPVFQSAVRFAAGVVNGLQLPTRVYPFELALFRYESAAAGEDWDNGNWATDLSWKMINAYDLS